MKIGDGSQQWGGGRLGGGWLVIIDFFSMNNIYYVGRRNLTGEGRQQSVLDATKKRQVPSPYSQRETSGSSSRKTEPKYSRLPLRMATQQHSLSRHRNNIRMNTEQNTLRERSIRVVIRQSGQSSTPSECSAFSMQSLQFKVKFNRVQQPKTTKPTNWFYRAEMAPQDRKRSTQPKCEQPRASRQTTGNEGDQSYKESAHPNNTIPEDSEGSSEYSQLSQVYKIQPQRQLFLCDSCMLCLPIIEIKSHYMQCLQPKTYQEHLTRWERAVELLQEIYGRHPSNQLFTLVQLMTAYPDTRKIRQPAPALYSEQLQRILRYFPLLQLQEVRGEDFGNLIERLGDKLQTLSKGSSSWVWCS